MAVEHLPRTESAARSELSGGAVASSLRPVYFDYAATTPVAPEVAAEMAQHLTLNGNFGNPASRSHGYGWQAEQAVERARSRVARLVGARPSEIIWTSGATEANNLALKGAAELYRREHPHGGHLIVSAVEHKSVLDPAHWLESAGFAVTRVAPTPEGLITPAILQAALRDDTFLISVMHVNNELGSVNDLKSLSAVRRGRRILFHSDAAQSAGKVELDVGAFDLDLVSLSAHKFYGPKGIGALYVRASDMPRIAAQIHGGGHELNLRSGTLPTHQCVGMGAAAALAEQTRLEDSERVTRLREELWQGLAGLPGIQRNGPLSGGVSGILSVAFSANSRASRSSDALLASLSQLAISTGSACNSASAAPSYVLQAVGLGAAGAVLRFSLGRYTTTEEVQFAIASVTEAVTRLNEQVASRA
jgi:cysteine desulfurase